MTLFARSSILRIPSLRLQSFRLLPHRLLSHRLLSHRLLRSRTILALPLALVCFTAGVAGAQAQAKAKQAAEPLAAPAAATSDGTTPDRSTAYYHFGLARMYEDMATNAGRADYAAQAIEQYKLALDADPNSPQLQSGLAELYFKLGRIREAVTAAQEEIKRNPNDLEAHQLLGRIYLRSLGDSQGAQSADMLKLAIAEYERITELKPDDLEGRLLLGQLYGLNHDTAKAEQQFKQAQRIDANSEDVVLNMARLYSEQGNNQRALDVLKAVPEDDRTERIDFALGATYDQMRKPHEAIPFYKSVLDQEPGNLDAQRALATSLIADDQFDAALPVLQKLSVAEPQDAQLQVRIAEVQRHQGNYEAALATLRKARAGTQDPSELEYNEALTLDALGRYDEAIDTLNKLLAETVHADGTYSEGERTNRAIFLDRLGIIDREQNKTAEAVAAYKQMIPLGSDYVSRGYQGMVDSYRDAHQWKEATAAAADAAKAMPKDRGIQMMYAQQLADNGKPDEGLAIIRAQLKHNADDRDVYIALASVETRLNRFDQALADLDEAQKLSTAPNDRLYVEFLRGSLYDREKKYPEAEAAFHKALDIDPQNSAVLNYLGYMLADRGEKLPEALGYLKTAVKLDPQNGAYLDSLGWVYYKMGDYKLAEQNLVQADERIASDPEVHDHLGQLYDKTGRLHLAVTQWERAMTEYAHSLPADADPADVQKVQHQLQGARTKLAKAPATK
jgi:tetratricopeptide (TPR) repeat protein